MSENWNIKDDESTAPLSDGADNPDALGGEGDFSTEQKSPISKSTLILIGTFALGLAMIYVLGLQAKPRQASAAQMAMETQVDSALAQMLAKTGNKDDIKSLFKDTDQLVRMFYNYPGVAAVTAEELPLNPFEVDSPKVESSVIDVPHVTNSAADLEKLRKVAEAFSTLKLQSVMMSKNMAAAMINNKLVTVGGKVGEFTVTEIESNRVLLTHSNKTFELKLQRPTPN